MVKNKGIGHRSRALNLEGWRMFEAKDVDEMVNTGEDTTGAIIGLSAG